MQTPTLPVAAAYPCAAWPAPCSWRTRMCRIVESMRGSYAGRIAPPGMPKMFSAPAASSDLIRLCAPVIRVPVLCSLIPLLPSLATSVPPASRACLACPTKNPSAGRATRGDARAVVCRLSSRVACVQEALCACPHASRRSPQRHASMTGVPRSGLGIHSVDFSTNADVPVDSRILGTISALRCRGSHDRVTCVRGPHLQGFAQSPPTVRKGTRVNRTRTFRWSALTALALAATAASASPSIATGPDSRPAKAGPCVSRPPAPPGRQDHEPGPPGSRRAAPRPSSCGWPGAGAADVLPPPVAPRRVRSTARAQVDAHRRERARRRPQGVTRPRSTCSRSRTPSRAWA